MKYTKIIKQGNSKDIANWKVQWLHNMESIDRLYAEKFHLERHKLNGGLNLINRMIAKLAVAQIALDYKIQNYHREKNEFLYNQFLINKPNQL